MFSDKQVWTNSADQEHTAPGETVELFNGQTGKGQSTVSNFSAF